MCRGEAIALASVAMFLSEIQQGNGLAHCWALVYWYFSHALADTTRSHKTLPTRGLACLFMHNDKLKASLTLAVFATGQNDNCTGGTFTVLVPTIPSWFYVNMCFVSCSWNPALQVFDGNSQYHAVRMNLNLPQMTLLRFPVHPKASWALQ